MRNSNRRHLAFTEPAMGIVRVPVRAKGDKKAMKTNHMYLIFTVSAITFLFARTPLAKDIGVCVQIIEHQEHQEKEHKSDTDTQKKNQDMNTETTGDQTAATPAEEPPDDATSEGVPSPVRDTSSGQDIAEAVQLPPLPPEYASSETDNTGGTTAAEMYPESDSETITMQAARELKFEDSNWDQEIGILPYGQTALVYLKRLVEHFVTHEPGFASTTQSCEQTITVELYPLKKGWTAFARYSGTNREERVDQLLATELSQFAERAVLALLHDVPISATIKRDNVLSSDSNRQVQQVKGSNHFTLNIGTRIIGAWVDQMQTDGDDAGGVKEQLRIYHPMQFGLGYRGRFENWGLEVQGGLGIGVGKKAASNNPEGGHIDYGGDTGLAIHFLHYREPRGLVSFYLGGGAGFQFTWFSVVNEQQEYDARSYLYSGGLTADGIWGWEFMRAASIQFFIQGELNLPLYVTRSENSNGQINSWMPGLSFKLGVVF